MVSSHCQALPPVSNTLQRFYDNFSSFLWRHHPMLTHSPVPTPFINYENNSKSISSPIFQIVIAHLIFEMKSMFRDKNLVGVNNNGTLKKLHICKFFTHYDDIGGQTKAAEVKETSPRSAIISILPLSIFNFLCPLHPFLGLLILLYKDLLYEAII